MTALGLSLALNGYVQVSTWGAYWANLITALAIFLVAIVVFVVAVVLFAFQRRLSETIKFIFIGTLLGFGINWIWVGAANKERRKQEFVYTYSPYSNSDSLSFNLRENVEVIPMDMISREKVESIRIVSNQLQSLPEDLPEVVNLTSLGLHDAGVLDLDQAFGIIPQLKLEKLELTGLSAKYLPADLAEVKTLTSISLSSNAAMDLDSLTSLLSLLPNLEELKLNNLPHTQLPESIGRLSHLKKLDLAFSELQQLPKALESFDSLEVLILTSSPVLDNWWDYLDSAKIEYRVVPEK